MGALIERLISFLVIIMMIRSGVSFVQRIMSGGQQRPPFVRPDERSEARGAKPPAAESATMLQQDPVCGTYVSIETSLKRICNGKVVHFCSDACRDRYPV